MKIAFAALYDLSDINRGSGSYYHLANEICNQGHTLHELKVELNEFPICTRVFGKLSRSAGKKYRSYQDPFVAGLIGREVRRLVDRLNFDVLLTNDYSIVGYAGIKKPLVLYTDAMFPHDFRNNWHPWYAELSGLSVRFIQHVTRRGLEKADLCLFAAGFAKEEALKYVPGRAEKLGVIPFGANLEDPGVEITQKRILEFNPGVKQFQLLFIGKDWQLKGGDIALKTTRELNQRSFTTHLHIVGGSPPFPIQEKYIHKHGFLDKRINSEMKKLHNLYCKADALLLPSKAEGFGVVFAEAAAYGLPSLAYKTQGVNTAVKNGESGILLEPTSTYSDFADVVQSWFEEPDDYKKYVSSARNYYETTLNWKVTVNKLLENIKKITLQ